MTQSDWQRYHERHTPGVAYVLLYDVYVVGYGKRASRKGFITWTGEHHPAASRYRFFAPSAETAYSYLCSVYEPNDSRRLDAAWVVEYHGRSVPASDPSLLDGSIPVIGFLPPPPGRPLDEPANAAWLAS